MCLEDKIFPKANSFIDKIQPLAPIMEFTGKIKAVKDSQPDDDFCVVARVEALIAGYEHSEALRRAEAYCEAGADAVLIHSKERTPHQIESFMQSWNGNCPVVIVPTKYNTTPTSNFRSWKISTVIWANHNFRASLQAMQSISAKIMSEQSIADLDQDIAEVDEIFRLTNDAELREAQGRYQPVASKT